jgi:hypothetical protein
MTGAFGGGGGGNEPAEAAQGQQYAAPQSYDQQQVRTLLFHALAD